MTASTSAVNGSDERRHVPDGGGGSAWGAQNNTGGGEKVVREEGKVKRVAMVNATIVYTSARVDGSRQTAGQ